MSEEEIIEEIKYNILNDPFTVFSQDSSFESNQIRANAIQGLLDLYNKEKEKRIDLEKELAKRQWVKIKENGEVKPLFYISKDKIREIINKYVNIDEHLRSYNQELYGRELADMITELLEERN